MDELWQSNATEPKQNQFSATLACLHENTHTQYICSGSTFTASHLFNLFIVHDLYSDMENALNDLFEIKMNKKRLDQHGFALTMKFD